MRRTKIALLAGISSLALHVATPAAFAADMAVKSPPVPKTPSGTWTWWAEGGASGLVGDPLVAGFNNPAFDINAKRWGSQGAVGFDYRFVASPLHVSADFRYMANGSNSLGGPETAIFSPGTGAGAGPVTGANSATRREHNWEADFMVGRDLQIGSPAQLKFGLRVADIWGQTTGTANWAFVIITPPSKAGAFSQASSYQQTNKWIGAGPRAAIEGSVPLQGAWSFDYNGGIAGLFGRNSVNQIVTVTTTGPGKSVCLSGCPIAASSSADVFVFNADAQVGVAYALSKNAKLSANYRVDGYWNAMRGLNAAGSPTNLSRVYQGPTLKLTVTY